jgi:subtilase-type serine protease
MAGRYCRLIGGAWAYLAGRAVVGSAAAFGAVLLCVPLAEAACTPPAGPGTPPPGTTVTCTGATGGLTYGDGSQNGLTINIVSGATVFSATDDFHVGSNNTFNNSGALSSTLGASINANGPLTVNNDGTINGGFQSILASGSSTIVNSGSIRTARSILTGTNNAAIETHGSAVITNTSTGVIAGPGGITATGPLNLTNFGTVSSVIASGPLTVTNFGSIANADILFASGITSSAGSASIFNAGTISNPLSTAIQFGGTNNVLTLAPTSVINGLVVGSGFSTLQLGGPGAGTLDVSLIGPAAQYRNFSSYNKIDDSTWTLTGTNIMTFMLWNVLGGTLNVSGTMFSSFFFVQNSTLSVGGRTADVIVDSGGILKGTGNTGQVTVNPGGTLSPGNSIGTISIGGRLTFVGAGNFLVEVSPAAADRANVTGSPGTAVLAGTLSAIGTGGAYTAGTRYTVLNAAGSVSGTFANLAVSGDFGVTKPHIEYDANNVYLVLDPNAISPFVTGGTRNQRAVASAIDSAIAAGSTNAPFAALFGLSAAQLPGALDALSGEVHASTAGVLVDESLYPRSAVLGRLRQASYGGDAGMASLAAGGPQAFQAGEELSALAYGKSPIVTKAPPMAARPGHDTVFWAQGFGGWGRFDGDGNAASVRRDLAGFFSGVDTRVGTNGRVGIAAGYTGSHNNLDGRGGTSVETGHLAGYGGWNFGSLNLRAGGAYAWHMIDTSRTAAFPGFVDTLTAHYDGRTGQIFGEAGYGFAFGKVAVEPFAGGAWVHLKTDGTTERGGAAALNVAANSFDVGYSTLGVRAASMIPLGSDMVLVPRASAAWQHAFSGVTPEARLAFIAAPVPFVVAGVPIARDSLLGEAGLDLAIGRNATVGVSYVGQLARNLHDHAAKGKFSWKF